MQSVSKDDPVPSGASFETPAAQAPQDEGGGSENVDGRDEPGHDGDAGAYSGYLRWVTACPSTPPLASSAWMVHW
jgi:hypothetical protein